jgi:PAS domain S-box-containing protein
MSELSGPEVLKSLRATCLDIPCIIIAENITEEMAVAAMKAGAKDYIVKERLSRLGSAIEREIEEVAIRWEYQKMEQALKESSEFKAILLASAPTAMIVYNPDTSIMYLNPQAEYLTGYTAKDTMGLKAPYPWWPQKKYDEYSKILGEVKSGKIITGERQFIRKNGTEFWAKTVHVPIIVGNELKYLLTNWVDTTEQKKLREEREHFTKKMMAVQEDERKRVARELHDDTAQNLALLSLEIDALIHYPEIQSEKILAKLKQLKEDSDRTINDVRRYSHALRPGVLDLGLEAALEQLAAETSDVGGLDIRFEAQGEEKSLPEEVNLALFRIAQEAVNNIRKHAQCKMAMLQVEYLADMVRMIIADDGRGFNPKMVNMMSKNSLGLIGMRERAQLIGANLTIDSKAGKGTTISVEVPIEKNST